MSALIDDLDLFGTSPSSASESDSESNSSGNGTVAESGWQSSVSLNYPLGMMIVVAVLLFVVIIGTATGNLFVVIALVRYRNLRTVSNYLIGNLAVSDFLLATTILPLSTVNECLGYWVFGRTACEIWLTLDVLYCTASIWNLCAIASDRFTATMFPVWYRSRRSAERQAASYAGVVWCVATMICVPPLLGWEDAANQNYKYDPVNDVHACVLFQTRGYVIYSASGSFFVPLVVTLFFYASIFFVIHGRMRKTRRARAVNQKMTKKSTPSVSRTQTGTTESTKVSTKAGFSTMLTVDVEMSSMSASNVEISTADAALAPANQTNEIESNDEAANEKDATTDKNLLPVPTVVVKADSGPSRILLADKDENGCARLPVAQPDPDTVSIRSSLEPTKPDRLSTNRLSFMAVKNAFSRRQQELDGGGGRRHRSIDQREMRATIRMAIIIAFFCGFWLGFFVVYVVHGCCPECYVPRELDAFFFWLGYANSSVNPILYTIFNEEFRRAFLRILGWKMAGARKR